MATVYRCGETPAARSIREQIERRQGGWKDYLICAMGCITFFLIIAGLVEAAMSRTTSLLSVAVLPAAIFLFSLGDPRPDALAAAGQQGENVVNNKLARILPPSAYVFTNVVLDGAEIDHLVVSRAVYAIETKAWSGEITGGEDNAEWQRFKPRYGWKTGRNPVRQAKWAAGRSGLALRGLTGLRVCVQPFVVFANPNVSLDVHTQTPVVTLDQLPAAIKSFESRQAPGLSNTQRDRIRDALLARYPAQVA